MRNIYVGDVGVAVQYLQLALKRAGYLNEITGQFDKETCNALKEFMGEGVGMRLIFEQHSRRKILYSIQQLFLDNF